VTLLHQQHDVLKKFLKCPVISIAGDDMPEKWSKKVWDALLSTIQNGVIVSTYQVLYDALAHGFLTLDQTLKDSRKVIGLLVFDEGKLNILTQLDHDLKDHTQWRFNGGFTINLLMKSHVKILWSL